MNSLKSSYPIIGLFVGVLLIQGCSSYEPVPVSQCSSVIKHAKKVLGSAAPKSSEMKANCKEATDQERGCIMAATTKGLIAQCL